MMPNARLYCPATGEAVSFFVDPHLSESAHRSYVARLVRERDDYRAAEPNAGWRLESRGEVVGWHAWDPAPIGRAS